MKFSLRYRILLTLLPLLVILATLGTVAVVLLYQLGNRAGEILRENYDSVLYMERLGEALERIDSSFTFALAGEEARARKQYAEHWIQFDEHLRKEQGNITLPGERELVEKLTRLGQAYRRDGDAFFRLGGEQRHRAYFGAAGRPGLLAEFKQLKTTSGAILRINQENMEQASRDARRTAEASVLWFGAGLAIAVGLAVLIALRTVQSLLRPIRALTESAQAIGAGNLDQMVPVFGGDELGQLAGAFNAMARQLRAYREGQQARLQRLQQASQATIDAFPHPVLVVDHEGRAELANPAARRLFGLPDGAFAGGEWRWAGREKEDHSPLAPRPGPPAARLVPWVPPEPLRGPLQEVLREQRGYLPEGFDRTIPLRVGDEERTYLPRVLPVRDPHGQALGAAVLLEDVTRFRLLDQVKSNLVATASHELKTPLAGLRLAVHLLLEETVGPLNPKQLELLLDARDNTERLLAVIENLLNLARLEGEGRHLELRPERPEELLRQAAEEFAPRAEDRGVQLTVQAASDLPPVAADARQLGHALRNLLDNALRYTGRGGRVSLTARAADGAVVLAVSDTGPGIPPEHLPHVFERFFRIPGRSQEGGTGLGLAIAREVVTAHGGTVTCESRPGEGTTFHLTLPAWQGDKETGRQGDKETRGQSSGGG
jgi:two-component system, NtrC family, sensor histidine kinase KinB